jgi:xylitol oxidase
MSVTNWAGNVTFGPSGVERPTSLVELQQLVSSARHARALGSGHSFNRLADTEGVLISTAGLSRTVELDTAGRRVRVNAGLRYGEFVAQLDAAGLALPNLASLPHISVGGAVATGTHGSGVANRGLASAVVAVELVTADGDLVTIDATDPTFAGTVVALGALGVVAALTLQLVPAFELAQTVYDGVRFEEVTDRLDEVLAAAYSVSVFTDWRLDGRTQIWAKQLPGAELPALWCGGRPAERTQPALLGGDPAASTEQLGVPGPWYARLPHFRLDFTPSVGEELQSEYFVPRGVARNAVRAVAALQEHLQPVLQVSELRAIRADDQWLSPTRRDSVGLHFTWVKDEPAVRAVLEQLEAVLAPFDAVPHWGKVFTSPPQSLRPHYPHLPDFQALATRLDPRGTFRNPMTDRYLFEG